MSPCFNIEIDNEDEKKKETFQGYIDIEDYYHTKYLTKNKVQK